MARRDRRPLRSRGTAAGPGCWLGAQASLDFRDSRVSFRWRDYKAAGRNKVMTLPADEFLRRFLLHVLPSGFMRIRHFGLLANRHRKRKLERCRALLHASPPSEKTPESVAASIERLTGNDLTLCPCCKQGTMRVTGQLAPGAPASRGGDRCGYAGPRVSR